MKKSIFFLSLLFVLTLLGCANSSDSSDNSQTWTKKVVWFYNQEPYEYSTENHSGQSNWSQVYMYSCKHPSFTRIIKVGGCQKLNGVFQQPVLRDVNFVFPNQLQIVGGELLMILNNNTASIFTEPGCELAESSIHNRKIIFVFDDNSQLELFFYNADN